MAKRDPFDFTDAQHRRQCKVAGCWHPAVYDSGKLKSHGWCARCRAVAFGGATRAEVDARFGEVK